MLISAALARTAHWPIRPELFVAANVGSLFVNQAMFWPMAYSRRAAPPSAWGSVYA
jgi:hypothetical protein